MSNKYSPYHPCPVCGRQPKTGSYGVNYAWAECKGGFFKRHDPIRYETGYRMPSEIWIELASGWNDCTFKFWYNKIWPEERRQNIGRPKGGRHAHELH